jgi:hypothetical protein
MEEGKKEREHTTCMVKNVTRDKINEFNLTVRSLCPEISNVI